MKTLVKLVSPIIFVLLVFFSCSKAKLSLPAGWKIPLASDIRNDDWRKENIDRYMIVRGDFNGDGILDTARLLMREDGSMLGLFAFVSQKDGSFKVYLLDEMKATEAIHSMGIKKVSPGSYRTACGKGYWACGKDEVPNISLRNDAIDYFKTESANSYFYWDTQTNTFKRIWISD